MNAHPIEDEAPVTQWIDELRAGDDVAAGKLWIHFVQRLRDTVRRKLGPANRAVYDDEDAAQSAFHSLCRGIAAGRFPDLADRTSLWRLMLVIASRKVMHRHTYELRECRDSRRTLELSVVVQNDEHSQDAAFASAEPTPEFAAEFAETCGRLFEQLEDPELQRIGRLKLEGYTDKEIAAELQYTDRTIRRKVERIRRAWRDAFNDSTGGQTPDS